MKSATFTTRPSAARAHVRGPGADADSGLAEPARECSRGRFWLRLLVRSWLRYRLDAYARNLHAIAAQRENDFHAERLLHRAISATRSRLQSL